MRIKRLFSTLFLSVTVLTACQQNSNEITQGSLNLSSTSSNFIIEPDFSSTFNQAIHGIDTGYVKLNDINPQDVPEITLDFVAEVGKTLIEKSSNGFLCANVEMGKVENSTDLEMIPTILQLDEKGKVIWKKTYPYITRTGTINHLLVLEDGSFVFSIQTYPTSEASEMKYEKSFIIKCDAKGNELWKTDLEDYSGNLLNNLFITGQGDLMAVGIWRAINGEQTTQSVADDIVITHLNLKDGTIFNQKSFGGNDFEFIYQSTYDPSVGIVVSGSTQSKDGDFGVGTDLDQSAGDFIACIDESLTVKWVYHCTEMEQLLGNQLVIAQGCINTLLYKPFSEKAVYSPSAKLLQLDKDGEVTFKKDQVLDGLFCNVLRVLNNGDIVIGAGQLNQGGITILDQKGNEKSLLMELAYAPDDILPTVDGGFIAAAYREIKSAPQPAYISSIWYDTERLVVKYDKDYTVEWQKTYDAHADVMYMDFVKTFAEGKVLVNAIIDHKLTLEIVEELSKKGEQLSWEDFKIYDGSDIGSGLYIREYPIDDQYKVLIGAGSPTDKPMYIVLIKKDTEERIDIRYEDMDEFIHKE